MREITPTNREWAELRREAKDAERRAGDLDKQLATAKQEKVRLEERVASQDAAIKTNQVEGAKARVPALFEKAKAERKLEIRQSKFIAARLARFVPVKPEEVEKEFNTFLDGEIDEEKRLAKDVYGVVDKGGGKEGAEPDVTEAGGDAQAAYLDPAKNEMIKLD
jgi:chromosome segregation ATPase